MIATGKRPRAARAVPARPLRARSAAARAARRRNGPCVSAQSTQLRVAIIGTGNIGTDLMMKVAAQPVARARRDGRHRPGVRRPAQGARARHHRRRTTGSRACSSWSTTSTSRSTPPRPARTPSTRGCWPTRGIRSVDLTPAALGPAVVPPVNLDAAPRRARGQPRSPAARRPRSRSWPRSRASPTCAYAETVSTVSSRSAGPGTRQNIDEFTTLDRARAGDGRRRARGQGDHHPEPGRPARS